MRKHWIFYLSWEDDLMGKNYANLIYENEEYLKRWAQEKNEVDLYKDKIKMTGYYWFKCPEGHYKKATLKNFLKSPFYCAECERLKRCVGSKPEIMKFWDFEKNKGIDPFYHYEYENIEIYWKCKNCGYEWHSELRSGGNKRMCPCCEVGTAIQPGYNDVFTVVPILKEDFIQEENPGIDMTKIGVADKKTRINWTCHVCGYKWPSTIFSRTRGHKGENKINKCPVCGKCKRVKPFSEDYPDLDEMWNEELNGKKFSEIPAEYSIKYWWNCKKHGPYPQSLAAMVRARKTESKGCPYCRSRKLHDYQTLYYQYKELIDTEWAPENKYLVDPKKISPKNNTKVFWICDECKEKYPMSISRRVLYYKRHKTACPNCKNRPINKGHIVL